MRTSTVATASKKVTLITSNHNLPLSSSRCKVLYFLFSRINKLNRHFLRWHFFFQLFAPIETILSHQSLSACKDGRYREKNVLSAIRNKVFRQNCSQGITRFRIVYDDQLKRSVSCVSTNAFLSSVRKTEGKCEFQI